MKERLQGKWCPSARRTAWETGLRAALALLFTTALLLALSGCTNPLDPDSSFVAVTDIRGVPTQVAVGTEINLTAASVVPTNATYQTISWELAQENDTKVTADQVASGKFTPSAAGTLS